jgi:hypothetical protein
MGFLDKFKQEKDLSSGLNLPDSDDDAPDFDDHDPRGPPGLEQDESEINSDPDFSGGDHPHSPDDDGLHDDVKLILERLDTVKSQLQHVQSRLDQLESDHGRKNRR